MDECEFFDKLSFVSGYLKTFVVCCVAERR